MTSGADWTGADWMNPAAQLFWENYNEGPTSIDEDLGNGRSISHEFSGCATCNGVGDCGDCREGA